MPCRRHVHASCACRNLQCLLTRQSRRGALLVHDAYTTRPSRRVLLRRRRCHHRCLRRREVLHQSGAMTSLGARSIAALLACVHVEVHILRRTNDTIKVARRAKKVSTRSIVKCQALQRVLAHRAVARDASVPRDPGCCLHVRSV